MFKFADWVDQYLPGIGRWTFHGPTLRGENLPMRRLKNRSQFLNAARGNRFAGKFFVLQSVRNEFDDCAVGYTVTKRMGNSPERSRIKRRLRAAVSACSAGFLAKHDYVLIGRRDALGAKFSTLVNNLEHALKYTHKNTAAG